MNRDPLRSFKVTVSYGMKENFKTVPFFFEEQSTMGPVKACIVTAFRVASMLRRYDIHEFHKVDI